MIASIFLMMVIFCIAIFKKIEGLNPMVGFALISWLVLLLVSIKHFPFATIILCLACVLTLIAVLVALNKTNKSQFVLLSMSILLSLTFYLIPANARYHLLSIKWNQEINSDYLSYDKYSWFLYQDEHYEEALIASKKAKIIVEKTGDIMWVDLIAQHEEQIKNRNWNKYQ
jgi:hypothetical protein